MEKNTEERKQKTTVSPLDADSLVVTPMLPRKNLISLTLPKTTITSPRTHAFLALKPSTRRTNPPMNPDKTHNPAIPYLQIPQLPSEVIDHQTIQKPPSDGPRKL